MPGPSSSDKIIQLVPVVDGEQITEHANSSSSAAAQSAPWHKRSTETTKQYHAFEHYLNTGRVTDAYREHCAECLNRGYPGAPARNWKTWAKQNEWPHRFELYEHYLAAERLTSRERELWDAKDAVASISRIGLEKVAARLRDLDILEIPATALPDWARRMAELNFAANGEDPDINRETIVEVRWHTSDGQADNTIEGAEDTPSLPAVRGG